MNTQARRAASEFLGTAFLLAAVVGSGIMGERLSGGNGAVALLANALATGFALVALILTFGPLSGAHFNPLVTLASAFRGAFPWKEVPAFLAAQIAGAVSGVALANLMFEGPVISLSRHVREGPAQWLSEVVATFGLLAVVFGCARRRPGVAPFAVGAYIASAYWFTGSTSFANPAVTIARTLTDTFAGIRPVDAPGFIVAQVAGAVVAVGLFRWLMPSSVKTVLFACVHNAGRSQMAAALFNARVDPVKARAVSAGTQPGERVHPEVVEALKELAIDVSGARPRLLTPELAREASILVTMGCGEACPVVPGLERLDWPLEDPKGKPIERVREIREEVVRRVGELLAQRGWTT